jgi:hypothetical protein
MPLDTTAAVAVVAALLALSWLIPVIICLPNCFKPPRTTGLLEGTKGGAPAGEDDPVDPTRWSHRTKLAVTAVYCAGMVAAGLMGGAAGCVRCRRAAAFQASNHSTTAVCRLYRL